MTNFSYADLEQAISPARAKRYLDSTVDPASGQPNPARAVALYEHDANLGAAAWGAVGDIEVRSIIADAIAGHHATIRANPMHRWYDDPPWFTSGQWFTTDTLKSINLAMKRVKDPGPGTSPRPGEGRVVAELTLGF